MSGTKIRRIRVTHGGLAFDVTTPSPESKVGILPVGDCNDEERDYILSFTPALEKLEAASTTVAITDMTSRRTDTHFVVLPRTLHRSIQDTYLLFPTHTVHSNLLISWMDAVHVSLQNTQMRGDVQVPVWKPRFRLGWFVNCELSAALAGDSSQLTNGDAAAVSSSLTNGDAPMRSPASAAGAANAGERYRPLPYIDPLAPLPRSIDVSLLQQGSTIVSKPSGGITSSRGPKLLGYYQSADGKPETFTGWKAVAVRFGRVYETAVVGVFLKHHPEYAFQEAGFMAFESDLTGVDGAQVDGLLIPTRSGGINSPSTIEMSVNVGMIEDDEELDRVMKLIPSSGITPSPLRGEGVIPIEIKCSRSNSSIEPSHLVQCVLELACGFPYMYLVRFCERQVRTPPGSNVWTTVRECKEIRIHRSKEIEDKTIALCRQAKSLNHVQFTELMKTPPYVEIRAYYDNLAVRCNAEAKLIPVDEGLFERLIKYKEEAMATDVPIPLMEPLLERIERRQARIFAARQEGEDLRVDVLEQIQELAELLR